jgi:hypothetical protein
VTNTHWPVPIPSLEVNSIADVQNDLANGKSHRPYKVTDGIDTGI